MIVTRKTNHLPYLFANTCYLVSNLDWFLDYKPCLFRQADLGGGIYFWPTNRVLLSPYLQVRGIRGYSVISLLKGVDISEHFLIDYMHGACSGVMKRLIGCWIDPTNKKQPYYIGQYLTIINTRISRISPPSVMRRYPKPLTGYKLCYKGMHFKKILKQATPLLSHSKKANHYCNHLILCQY